MSITTATISALGGLATTTDDGYGYDLGDSYFNPASAVGGVIGYIITVIALWQVFKKAGWTPWFALIPFLNAYVIIKIAGFHGAFLLLYFIPIVNFVFAIFVALRLGKAFGKGGVFSFFLLWLFAVIGYYVIGFGGARYIGPGGDASAARR